MKQDVKLFLSKTSLDEDCDFVIDLVLNETGTRLDCRLENGVKLSLTFVQGDIKHLANLV